MGVRVHLFVNSGMNREGIKDLPLFWQENKDDLAKVRIAGLCSHLADAGDAVLIPINRKNFFESLDFLRRQGTSAHGSSWQQRRRFFSARRALGPLFVPAWRFMATILSANTVLIAKKLKI